MNRLRDVLPKKDRNEIKGKLYKTGHQINISEEERERWIPSKISKNSSW